MTFELRCEDGVGALTLRWVARTPDAEGWRFYTAALGGPVVAEAAVPNLNPPWPAFFSELARNWRGWNGELAAESIEGQLRICATCDSLGHVTFVVELEPVRQPSAWRAVAELSVVAGSLERLAKDAQRFFSL